MTDHLFTARPHRTPMVLWTGSNWDEVRAFFAARGYLGAVVDDDSFLLCCGLLNLGPSGVPVFQLAVAAAPVWLADVNDLRGQGYPPGMTPIETFALDIAGDPIGFDPVTS